MNVETITFSGPSSKGPTTFNLLGLSQFEVELLQEGLIELKNNKLKDAEEFKAERHSCVEMYQAIDEAVTH